MFMEVESGDHLLVLPPLYARLFVASIPSMMGKSQYGFRDTKSGNNKRAFFEGLTDQDIKKVNGFIEYYKTRVVLGRNCHINPYFSDEVDFCLALDFIRSEPRATQRTEIGELEYSAKYHHDDDCCDELAKLLTTAVRRLPPTIFAKPRRITYIPTDPDRGFYLPWYLTEAVVEAMPEAFWGHDDPMLESSLTVEKASAKNLTVEEKIEQWEEILDAEGIELSDDIEGQSVCIVDDLYQSGASLWSYAKYLREAGAQHVVGVVCVKSLRDTDNQ